MARFLFGRFEFDPAAGILLREGVPVRLQPQPARVLAQLVARSGEVVTRDELRQAVWADGTFVDFERGLNFCIAQIRLALGDSADAPRYIETLPRRGYRLIAPVRAIDAATGAEPATQPVHLSSAEAAAGQAAAPPAARRWRWGIALAVVVAAAGVAGWVAGPWQAAAPVRIAVVPFDNETGQTEYDVIARGIADATVARLATEERLGEVSVIGNAAALTPPRRFRDVKAIGEAVDARYVVVAQVKRDESRVRLIAHLIRVGDEAHVWANTYDRSAFTLEAQAEIAEAIAAAVTGRLRDRR